ncbi:hypothetical protein OAV19_00445 [bacterium]|nr:hypothetical protein [bacterium]
MKLAKKQQRFTFTKQPQTPTAPPLKQTGGFGGRNQNEHHVKTFKKHPVTINALQFFVQYLGAEVEGNCKWHITSIDIPNIDSEIDTLWHTKEEAIQAIQEFIA